MSYGTYLVVGSRAYRGHNPGTRFDARLDHAREQRAVGRGDIKLLRRVIPALEEGSYQLPPGWPSAATPSEPLEAPQGAFFIEGS